MCSGHCHRRWHRWEEDGQLRRPGQVWVRLTGVLGPGHHYSPRVPRQLPANVQLSRDAGPGPLSTRPRGANKRKPCTLTSGRGPESALHAAICHLPTRWRCAHTAEAAAPPRGRPPSAGPARPRALNLGCGMWNLGTWGLRDLRWRYGVGGQGGAGAWGSRMRGCWRGSGLRRAFTARLLAPREKEGPSACPPTSLPSPPPAPQHNFWVSSQRLPLTGCTALGQ